MRRLTEITWLLAAVLCTTTMLSSIAVVAAVESLEVLEQTSTELAEFEEAEAITERSVRRHFRRNQAAPLVAAGKPVVFPSKTVAAAVDSSERSQLNGFGGYLRI